MSTSARATASTSPDAWPRTPGRATTGSGATAPRFTPPEVVFLDSRGGNGGKDNGDASDIEEPVAASPF